MTKIISEISREGDGNYVRAFTYREQVEVIRKIFSQMTKESFEKRAKALETPVKLGEHHSLLRTWVRDNGRQP